MATGEIKQNVDVYGSNTNGNYCKMLNGTLICWGKITISVSGEMSQVGNTGIYTSPAIYINFPVTFMGDSNYIVTGVSRYSTGNTLPIGTIPSTNSKFGAVVYDFYKRSLNDGTYILRWQAVGRWK